MENGHLNAGQRTVEICRQMLVNFKELSMQPSIRNVLTEFMAERKTEKPEKWNLKEKKLTEELSRNSGLAEHHTALGSGFEDWNGDRIDLNTELEDAKLYKGITFGRKQKRFHHAVRSPKRYLISSVIEIMTSNKILFSLQNNPV